MSLKKKHIPDDPKEATRQIWQEVTNNQQAISALQALVTASVTTSQIIDMIKDEARAAFVYQLPVVYDKDAHVLGIRQKAIDHGALTGLLDDDHTQYILVAGTREFTGDQSMGSHKITNLAAPSSAGDAIRATAVITEAALESTIGNAHARAHNLLDTNDHADVATYLDQALLTTSSPTFGAITIDGISQLTGAVRIGHVGYPSNGLSESKMMMGAAASGALQRLYCFSATLADECALSFFKSHNDTWDTLTETIDNDKLGGFYFRGVDSGGNLDYGAYISVIQNGAAGTKVPTDIEFYTSTDSATTLRMTIGTAGQITVGAPDTADANALLRVWKGTAGTVSAPTNSILTVENSDDGFFSMLVPNDKSTGFYFGSPIDNDSGALLYYADATPAASYYTIKCGGVNIMKWLSGGVIIDNGGAAGSNNALFDVVQNSDSAAIPVLYLKQDDVDDAFINYVGTTAADQTKSISTADGDGAMTGPHVFSSVAGWAFMGMIKKQLNGSPIWIAYYVPSTE